MNLILTPAKSLKDIMVIIHDWRSKYGKNNEGDIIFQNKATYTNVRLTDNGIHAIQDHSKGFESIPDAIENPDEIWSYWKDPKEQKVTMRNYILLGKTCFVVNTQDGIIMNTFAVSLSQCNKFRIGVPLL